MTDTSKKMVKEFVHRWTAKSYENGESQIFWIDLLQNVYGVDNISEFITFEEQVKLDHTSFIDGYIEATHVIIEQKSLGKDLPKEYYRLKFLVDIGNDRIEREMQISLQAGELVGKLYDLILQQYKNPDSAETLRSLNMLCVRLVFCLYAEDSGIIGNHKMFRNYLKQFQPKQVREEIIKLFKVLGTKPENRAPYMNDDLSAFPYVNGGLFADENIEVLRFTEEIVNLLLNGASKTFNWADISQIIFGAVFESTLNPETRRSGGMHYTSIENIHKVIGPLF